LKLPDEISTPPFGDVGPALDAMLAVALDDLYAANWPEEEDDA
jgi:hypothetical protein